MTEGLNPYGLDSLELEEANIKSITWILLD